MPDKFFLDTNVIIYSFDSSHPKRQKIARELIREALVEGAGCISYQVIEEFLNVATKKFAVPLSYRDSHNYLTTVLEPLCTAYVSTDLYYLALEIAERWQYSFNDALIISAALQNNCNVLYSEDLKDGQVIKDLRIVNPFKFIERKNYMSEL